jgi:hypothetical protein
VRRWNAARRGRAAIACCSSLAGAARPHGTEGSVVSMQSSAQCLANQALTWARKESGANGDLPPAQNRPRTSLRSTAYGISGLLGPIPPSRCHSLAHNLCMYACGRSGRILQTWPRARTAEQQPILVNGARNIPEKSGRSQRGGSKAVDHLCLSRLLITPIVKNS